MATLNVKNVGEKTRQNKFSPLVTHNQIIIIIIKKHLCETSCPCWYTTSKTNANTLSPFRILSISQLFFFFLPEWTNWNNDRSEWIYDLDVKGRGCLSVMRWNNKKQSRKKPNYGSNVPWSLLCPEGRKSRTQTNAGLHILTSKATGLVVILHFLSFPISILTNMNPNSRQVYTCISSADRLCISHTVSILFFFFFFFF